MTCTGTQAGTGDPLSTSIHHPCVQEHVGCPRGSASPPRTRTSPPQAALPVRVHAHLCVAVRARYDDDEMAVRLCAGRMHAPMHADGGEAVCVPEACMHA
eukprot:363414-Chlamydomonas_euryale.AAC.5